ncbi:FMN-binding split barrel [Ceraceosorus bombacis]|uniref:FMN-binding split barrel n=1 Tax=Ceraceosorus bombacis TaxID=401625 RepID=A0A0N7LB68_9BASI|nr:FMN-binding split barrel [Ceraceosorus bombacis]
MQDIPSSHISSSQKCFTHHHPDASHWVPGSDSPHLAKFVRFEVQKVYRVGGFGDESWIGWIDAEEWRRTRPETESDKDAWNIDRNWVREGMESDVSKSHSNDESQASETSDLVLYDVVFQGEVDPQEKR